jgi:uncharacterized membrane protein YhaH (DUF805 family)
MYGVTLVTFLAVMWCCIVLAVQRLRDMGWRPWLSLLAAVVCATLETALLEKAFGVSGFSASALAFVLALIAWPSRTEKRPAVPQPAVQAWRTQRVPGQFGLRQA